MVEQTFRFSYKTNIEYYVFFYNFMSRSKFKSFMRKETDENFIKCDCTTINNFHILCRLTFVFLRITISGAITFNKILICFFPHKTT
jgi:hypothetical protein